ncbi:hypothetical protein ACOSQ2_002783 [Xanthoceras sorbifolium]
MQPNKVIQLDAPEVTPSLSDWTLGPVAIKLLEWAPTLAGDFLTKGLSRHIEKDQGVILRHFLLRYFFMLTKETKRCQAFRNEMKQEMNACKAKYEDQIHGLKDEIEKAKIDLKHSYELLERSISLKSMRNLPRRIKAWRSARRRYRTKPTTISFLMSWSGTLTSTSAFLV